MYVPLSSPDNAYFVRRHTTDPQAVLRLSDVLATLDRSIRTTTLPPPLAHGRIRRRDAPSRRILRRVDLEGPAPRTVLSPLHHPDPSTRS